MWTLQFYRFYICLAAALFSYFFFFPSVWVSILVFIGLRTALFFIEKLIRGKKINKAFNRHAAEFKMAYGPYGIRIVNKAEADPAIKESLYEVFSPNLQTVKKNVEQLITMNVLFDAGMRPEGDQYLLHDLKLKYGKKRLDAAGISYEEDKKST